MIDIVVDSVDAVDIGSVVVWCENQPLFYIKLKSYFIIKLKIYIKFISTFILNQILIGIKLLIGIKSKEIELLAQGIDKNP